jgi:hypothetical protein
MKDTCEVQRPPCGNPEAINQREALPSRRTFLTGTTAGAVGMLTTMRLADGESAQAASKSPTGPVDLSGCLSVTNEFAHFVREAEEKLHAAKLKPGEDLEPLLEKSGVKIPEWLRGSGITYETSATELAKSDAGGLVIVTPGDPRIVEVRVFCICIRKWRVCVCLECGWIWCRIVIIGRF